MIDRLCNAILTSWWWAHVLETCRGMKYTYCKTKILCIKLVNYWDKCTEMHGQQNVKKKYRLLVKTSILRMQKRCSRTPYDIRCLLFLAKRKYANVLNISDKVLQWKFNFQVTDPLCAQDNSCIYSVSRHTQQNYASKGNSFGLLRVIVRPVCWRTWYDITWHAICLLQLDFHPVAVVEGHVQK